MWTSRRGQARRCTDSDFHREPDVTKKTKRLLVRETLAWIEQALRKHTRRRSVIPWPRAEGATPDTMCRNIGSRPCRHGLFAAHVLVFFGACLAASAALPNQIQLPTVAIGTTQEHSYGKPSSSVSRPCFLHYQAERLRVSANLRGLLMKRGPVNSTDLCALSGYDISRVAASSACLGWIPVPRQPKWFLRSCSHLFDTAPRCPDVSARQQPSIPKAAAVNLKHGPTLRADNKSLSSVASTLSSLKTFFADRKVGPVRSEHEMKHLLDTREFDVDDVYRQIRGDSATHEAVSGQHEVLQAIKARVESGSRPGHRRDKLKIALAIEGGGMRGCVSAGMAGKLAAKQSVKGSRCWNKMQ